jgi:hypothetical protein
MADIFSLAPEGQAWTDDAAKNNPARAEDYDPHFFAGSLSALPRGVAEGTIGLAQTGVATSKKLISDPEYLQQFVPTYGVFKSLFPDADQQLNASYDNASKALSQAQAFVRPDANSQGFAAQTLEGLGQFGPAIGATVVGGPVAGATVAAGSTFEPARQNFLSQGVNPDTAAGLAAEQSVTSAAGMALPAGIGGRLLTRLASGVAINAGFGAANRFAVGETLEDNGYNDLAVQYKVWDKQALLVDGVLGAAFGGLHHWTAGRTAPVAENVSTGLPNSGDLSINSPDLSPETGQNVPEPAQNVPESGPVVPVSTDSAPTTILPESPPAPTYESRVAEMQDLAGQLISRGDRQTLAGEVHDLQYQYDQSATELQQLKDAPLSGSGKALSAARAQRTARVNELDTQMGMLKEQIDQRNATLADNSRGGRFFEAKADLSRIQQGIIPESLRGLVPETQIKPSDIDAAHALNEGLNYDLESAPVIHGSIESLNSHVAAMDAAAGNLMRNEPVNVSQQIQGLGGIAKPGALELGLEQRAAMEEAYRENGIPTRHIEAESIEPPVVPGMVRVYHSGSVGEGETGRWVSTNRQYAADYRSDLPLHYLDLPESDSRVNSPDYPKEQGVKQGFHFSFELTPAEAARLQAIDREGAAPPVREDSAFSRDTTPEQVSVDPDTGLALSSNNFDLTSARDMAQANPNLEIIDPDTGQRVKLSDALAALDEQITNTQKESRVYSVAANCFLRNPS